MEPERRTRGSERRAPGLEAAAALGSARPGAVASVPAAALLSRVPWRPAQLSQRDWCRAAAPRPALAAAAGLCRGGGAARPSLQRLPPSAVPQEDSLPPESQ